MKYTRSMPTTDLVLKKQLLEEGFRPLKEPKNLLLAILSSFPFMFLNVLLCYGFLCIINSQAAASIRAVLTSSSWAFTIRFDYVIWLYAFVVLHEVLHLVFIPNFLQSKDTFWGIKPWGGFVFTTQPISKGRFLVVTLAPFVLLSFVLPAVLSVLGVLEGFILFLIFMNAAASSVDVLNVLLIMTQVKNNSTLIQNGFETYTRLDK